MSKVEIYTDGACKGNPGPGGWGAWLIAGEKSKELCGGELNTTNNRMELKAVIEALLGQTSEFARTPKYGIQRARDEWQHKRYHQALPIQSFVEVALGVYFTGTVYYALDRGIYGTLPFLVLFQVGFLYTGLLSVVQQYAADDSVALNTQVASGK